MKEPTETEGSLGDQNIDIQEDLRFEREFILTAWERARDELGFNKKRFADLAFADRKASGRYRALHEVLTVNRTGKPQRLTLADAYRIAKAIDTDLASFTFQVQAKIAWQERQRRISKAPLNNS